MDQLVLESAKSYNEYLSKLPGGCKKIADLLREDSLVEAFKLIITFSEGVEWLSRMNQLLNENGVDISLNIEKIHEFLEEVNNGLEIQDYIIVADMFEFEIEPFFRNCEFIKDV